MNSREHVLKALNHEQADRIPFDLGGTGATGIHIAALQEIDILNPVQKSASGIHLFELKREFGQDVVFWGRMGETVQQVGKY